MLHSEGGSLLKHEKIGMKHEICILNQILGANVRD